jgi:O-antigen ligase
MAMWQAGGNMFLHDPLLGIGIGNFTAVYPKFFAANWIYSRGHAHNYYIHAAAETGIIGLTAYLALLLTAYRLAWRTYRSSGEVALRYIAWGGFGTLTAVMVHNIVENLHVLNLGIEWSAVLALFYLIPLLEKKEKFPS